MDVSFGTKPLILLTNDDGIKSPGLLASIQAAESIGDLLIVAPSFQQTGMSRAHPNHKNQVVIEKLYLTANGKEHAAYAINGSPAQAVSHAITEITNRTPAICVSGINWGENVGLCISASGTLGAAYEANIYEIPAVAVSQQVPVDLDQATKYNSDLWQAAIYFTRFIIQKVLCYGLEKAIAVLNVNIPFNANLMTPIKITTQSRQKYYSFVQFGKRGFSQENQHVNKILINQDTLEESSDIKALVVDKAVSITPLTWDLTARCNWNLDKNNST